MNDIQLYLGDCLDVMQDMDDNSVDAVITDPPYGLEFMGKDWDKGVPGILFWKEMLRIAKPGATLLAMGGTRTYHRLVVAIEDAGWEIHDAIGWVYGSGFSKSYNISKGIDKKAGESREVLSSYEREGRSSGIMGKKVKITRNITAPATPDAKLWDGWGTALKPALELICVAQKPREGTYVENALKWGVAGYWIDGARVEVLKKDGGGWRPNCYDKDYEYDNDGQFLSEIANGKIGKRHPQGRFPANFIHDGSDEVLELMPETGKPCGGKKNTTHDTGMFGIGQPGIIYTDTDNGNNSAARFFYCAKASKSERNMGLDGIEKKLGESLEGGNDKRNGKDKPQLRPVQNHHPTVKPVALMEYLAKLTKTPTGGVVLDPFMGSGTTGIGCIQTGRKFIGIELNEEYYKIAEKRIAEAQKQIRMEI